MTSSPPSVDIPIDILAKIAKIGDWPTIRTIAQHVLLSANRQKEMELRQLTQPTDEQIQHINKKYADYVSEFYRLAVKYVSQGLTGKLLIDRSGEFLVFRSDDGNWNQVFLDKDNYFIESTPDTPEASKAFMDNTRNITLSTFEKDVITWAPAVDRYRKYIDRSLKSEKSELTRSWWLKRHNIYAPLAEDLMQKRQMLLHMREHLGMGGIRSARDSSKK